MFPELVTGREDGTPEGTWSVIAGSTARGSASCNVAERVLEVPLASSEQARCVRAHELMHARVSPLASHFERSLAEVPVRALECAEELRVNTLLTRLGFDTSWLVDGTEKPGGERLGEAHAWPEAVCFLAAVLGTGAERPFLAGIRRSRPEWLAGLRALRARVLEVVGGLETAVIASTALDDDGLPCGYVASTLAVARVLALAMVARVPVGAEEVRSFRRSLAPGGRRPATGVFAPLVLDRSLEGVSRRRVAAVRRERPATSGVVLRRPGRLVTDEHRRAFARRSRGHGGVVVIDQSGSMELDAHELARLVRRMPGSLVVGYSHRPGDLGTTPNAWLLAERGRVAARCPVGNVGNGVDGPVLRWAVSHRRGAEAVVWVTDGQVTDSHDHPAEELSRECAILVRRYGIRLARSLDEAVRLLRTNQALLAPDYGRFGRVGRELGRKPGK